VTPCAWLRHRRVIAWICAAALRLDSLARLPHRPAVLLERRAAAPRQTTQS